MIARLTATACGGFIGGVAVGIAITLIAVYDEKHPREEK